MEKIRRVAEVAKLMVDAGPIVLVSFISPFRAEWRMARSLFVEGEFVEVFVDMPLAVAEGRDVMRLYAKARAGALSKFTGIDPPYRCPNTRGGVAHARDSPEALADKLAAMVSR